MLYITLILAVVFYVSLFLMWGAIQPQLNSVTSVFASLKQIVMTVPDHTSMLLLKEMIMLTLIYLVLDGTLSLIRRAIQGKAPRPSWHDYPTTNGVSHNDWPS